jgi:phage terminase large subunit-like protein
VIDRAKADHVLAFVRLLKDPKGGSILSRPCIKWLPWQEKFFTDIFATVNKDGTRQYREAFVEIPRKNGKTTTIAACVVYQLFCSPEYGQEIYSAANDRDQAALVFNMAASMIRANPALRKRCTISTPRSA